MKEVCSTESLQKETEDLKFDLPDDDWLDNFLRKVKDLKFDLPDDDWLDNFLDKLSVDTEAILSDNTLTKVHSESGRCEKKKFDKQNGINKTIVSLKELAEIFGVSKQSIQKWRHEGMMDKCQTETGKYDLVCVYNWYWMYKVYDDDRLKEIEKRVKSMIRKRKALLKQANG
jgi:hypothetical protein